MPIIVPNTSERDATISHVQTNLDVAFTWDYERSRVPLSKLYEKAKGAQWNAQTDLDWSTDVDQIGRAHV